MRPTDGRTKSTKGKDFVMDIAITKTQTPKEKPDQKNLGFGHIFSDHMFIMDYERAGRLARRAHRALRSDRSLASRNHRPPLRSRDIRGAEGVPPTPTAEIQLFRPDREHPPHEPLGGAPLPAPARRRSLTPCRRSPPS